MNQPQAQEPKLTEEVAEGMSEESTEEAPVAESMMAAPVEQAPAANAEPSAPQDEPYDFDHCTITIGIQLLPVTEGDDPIERQVIIGVRNHDDPPIVRFATLAEVTFPTVIASLLAQLRAELPARQQARVERAAKALAEAEARKTKRAIVPPKKAKKKNNLMTAPPTPVVSPAVSSQTAPIDAGTIDALTTTATSVPVVRVQQQLLF